MSDAAYDGIIDYDFSFTFTPDAGSAFGSEQCQVEELTPAPASIEVAKFTPISGTNAGIEQIVLGKIPAQEVKFKATYKDTQHLAAMTCLASRSKGTLVITYGDGLVQTYTGAALTNVTSGMVNASNVRTDDLTFSTPMFPTEA